MLDFDEDTLIARTQHGDTEAFTPLVTTYHSRLYTHIFGRIKDAETAKDLTQETWIKAFRAIHTYRGESAFSTWLYRIAENVCIDFFRKQKAILKIDPLHTVKERHIIDTHPDPCDTLQTQELRKMLRVAIAHLPPIRKRVFLLHYIHEMPVKTIAKQMGRSEGTIKTHLRNARLQLRELLTPYLKNQHIPWLA